jgi:hypothetical protein
LKASSQNVLTKSKNSKKRTMPILPCQDSFPADHSNSALPPSLRNMNPNIRAPLAMASSPWPVRPSKTLLTRVRQSTIADCLFTLPREDRSTAQARPLQTTQRMTPAALMSLNDFPPLLSTSSTQQPVVMGKWVINAPAKVASN